jgi:inner membrane transporter RhtA
VGIFQSSRSGESFLKWEILPLALLVAILSSAIPYSLEMVALKRLPVKTFSIFMSLEPAFAAFAGWVFLKESLTIVQWSAIGCIIVASLGSSLTIRQQSLSTSTCELST